MFANERYQKVVAGMLTLNIERYGAEWKANATTHILQSRSSISEIEKNRIYDGEVTVRLS